MAGDQQVVRRGRLPRCCETDVEFPRELCHRGTERVDIYGGEKIVDARLATRVRRPLPKFPRHKGRHMDGPPTALPLLEIRRLRAASEMINEDTGVEDDACHDPDRLRTPQADVKYPHRLLP